MSLELKDLIPSGAGLVTTLGGLIWTWSKFQNKVENLEKKDEEQGRQLEVMWDWKDTHEKEAATNREAINKEISKLEGANLVVNEQFKQILNMLQDIKERMEKLENRKFN